MNIIVFGGTGFFGRAFIRELQKNPANNISLVVRNINSKLEGCQCVDYSEGHLLSLGGDKFDQAFDFSSHVSVDDFFTDPQKAFLENLEIPIKNIKFLNQLEFSGRYVYISTDRAVLDISDSDFISDLRIPNDPYGASKLIGEMISRYSFSFNVGFTSIVRFPNLYGPEQTSKQLIPTIADRIKNGVSEIELGSLFGSRNYLYISDAVNALIKLINSQEIESEICFSGVNYKIGDILEIIKTICVERFGYTPKFVARTSDSKRSFFQAPPSIMDDIVFREKYSWFPKVDMREGLLLTLEDS